MQTPRTRARAGLTLASAVTLGAIGAVLVLVSLPRLRGFVVRENEVDALGAVTLLADSLTAEPPGTSIESLVRGAALARRLPDATFLDAGRLMECHGYLFDLVELEPGAGVAEGVRAAAPAGSAGRAVRAWPAVAGETGTSALLATTGGTVLGHPNAALAFGGRLAPPPPPAREADRGWRALR